MRKIIFVLLIIIIKNHVFHIKAESSLVEEVCQVAREEEEQLVLLVQVMEDMPVVDTIVVGGGDQFDDGGSFFFKTMIILAQENLDWSKVAEEAAWLASQSETTVASLLSMAGQGMIMVMVMIMVIARS